MFPNDHVSEIAYNPYGLLTEDGCLALPVKTS